jgi:hypothetical protein
VTPGEWYASRDIEWSRRGDEANRRSITVSRLRLATFFGAVLLFWYASRSGSVIGAVAGALCLAAFAVLVAMHARLLTRIECAEAGRRVAQQGLARLARNWSALVEIAAPRSLDLDGHAYARDLDLFGHASLTAWLGPAATSMGQEVLLDWLLAPAARSSIERRQTAIAELSGRAEWREALAVEGRRGRTERVVLDRFFEWAHQPPSSTSRWLKPLVRILTIAIWVPLALQILGVLDEAWWAIPMLIGLVLSFAFAKSMYAVFDRASVGERGLQRFSTMLSLACGERWTAPELQHLQQQLRAGGDAPRVLKRLSRLVEWSELRTAAAILHFPIQALTLWDFHVFFAIERWRDAYGRQVRAWLSALAELDALALISAVGHDCPGWTTPAIDESSDRLSARDLGHPLIADAQRVANDVEIGPPGTLLLVTGSNMSGKSTLLRAIGLNIVLANTGAPVCAAAFSMPTLDLQTSIRVQDSLERGLSYFMAALARLKAIVDAAERDRSTGRRLMYLLDEVLQGTNSAERAIAVRAVAAHLLDAGAIGAMTTHDLAIAEQEPFASRARLVHFSEQVHEDGTMTFDYRLRAGLATSRNALRLMQLIGITPK